MRKNYFSTNDAVNFQQWKSKTYDTLNFMKLDLCTFISFFCPVIHILDIVWLHGVVIPIHPRSKFRAELGV